jgi:hypothetical protein
MTVLLEEPTTADDQNAQLLFKEARRRRRRLRIMWIAIGTTAVVFLVSLGLTLSLFSSPPAPSVGVTAQPGWPPHLRTGATLVYALNDLRVLDADSGASRVRLALSGGHQRSASRLRSIGRSIQGSEQRRSVDLDSALCAGDRVHELRSIPNGKRSLDR